MEEQKPVRFMGLYRNGLTQRNADFYKRLVKILYRRGKQGEGFLANQVKENLGSELWNDAMRDLEHFRAIQFLPAVMSRSRVVKLTGEGEVWGLDWCCDEQVIQTHHIPGSQAEAFAKKCAAERLEAEAKK